MNSIVWMVSLRGQKSSFYNSKEEAENVFCYLKKYFSDVSMVKTNCKRIIKNYYLNKNI